MAPLAIAYKVLGYPHLSMGLELDAVYTTAELELRCRAPHRRRQLHQKLADPRLFRPASLSAALEGPKNASAGSGKPLGPLWVRPPKIRSPKKDFQVGCRRAIANRLAKKLLDRSNSITDADVLKVLKAWAFHKNTLRKNVLPADGDGVFSDNLGLTLRRNGRVGISCLSRRYGPFTKLLCKWLQDNMPRSVPAFPWTSISVNCNYAAARHRDRNNAGPSLIRAFGKFSGGELLYWPKDAGSGPVSALSTAAAKKLPVKRAARLIDGTKAHEVRPFQGERYSLVFYSCGKCLNASSAIKMSLEGLGFRPPTAQALSCAKAAVVKRARRTPPESDRE